jgi:elongation factor Ts
MEAKKALQETNGDRDKARKLLEQRGMDRAEKASGKATGQGIVEAYIHAGGQVGVLIELDSETDFVARMPEFKELAHEIAMQVAAANPQYLSIDDVPTDEVKEIKARLREEAQKEGKPEKILEQIAEGKFKSWVEERVLLDQKYIRDNSKTVRQLVQDLAAKTRENIVVKRFARFRVGA